jgi:hypothetical protein
MAFETDAYKTTKIAGFLVKQVPNPDCCTEVSVMCGECVAKALKGEGYGRSDSYPTFNCRTEEPDGILPLPTTNWNEPPEGRPTLVPNASLSRIPGDIIYSDASSEMLTIPVINWASGASEEPITNETSDADCLPLPQWKW